MLQNGEIIGGMYQVVREIGKGGTGIIYLGNHLHLKKPIVIKKIKDSCVGKTNVRAEADILKQLRHTYLPQVYDFLEIGSGIYTVMDYIPGENLQYYLDRKYAFPEKTLILWLRQLCEVLDYLHTRNPVILHSDIKPANIMVTPEGDICLIDFNISLDGSVTQDVQGLTRGYASPEQYRCAMDKLYGRACRERLDARMDIYSLGAVFYRMMSGYQPDAETGIPYRLTQIDVPYREGLKKIVDRATEWEPERRFKTAAQMKQALERIEKYDPLYRRLGRLQILTGVTGGLLALSGVLLVYAGVLQGRRELWQETYTAFYAATLQGEPADIIQQGTALLNKSALQRYMSSHKEQKAEVLHAVGDAYYLQEQYAEAAGYYEEAYANDSEEALYLRDYMIAMARDGQQVDAAAVSAAYPEADLDEPSMLYVQAQADYGSGAYERALEECEAARTGSTDGELTARIWELQADIYNAQGQKGDAANAAAKAAELDPSANTLRRAAALSYNMVSEVSGTTQREAWCEQALEYYEALCGMDQPAYEDKINRAIVLRSLGRYQDSNEALREMRTEYPEEYRIQMWMCYNYLDLAQEAGSLDAVWSDLNFAYGSCESLYAKRGTAEKDPDMEELKERMK